MNEESKENLSILVVEDDAGDLGLLYAHLRLAGLGPRAEMVSTASAETLAEGLDAARRLRPDVILLDLSLPDSSGLATVQAMRAAAPDSAIVVLTGHDEKAVALAALEAGAQDYLVKGQFDHDALGRAVRHALVRGRLEQHLVHHQQHLEELVAARTAELARALEAAQAASHAKSTFLSNMSHEIRTPMNGIMGMTSILIDDATDPKVLDRLSNIDISAARLMNILNNVLNMASIEAGKVVLDERGFEPASLLRDVLAVLEGQATAKGLSLAMACDPALPAYLLGDPVRIRQVLGHLVSNAVKFSERGEVSLSARLKALDAEGVLVQFSVADTGIGIAAENIERVFRVFEQADNSSTRAYGGTGLGLAISRSLVELMGGRLEMRSVPGEGSEFSFAIRLKVAFPGARKVLGSPTGERLSLSGIRVLVADDDILNLEILFELLSSKGMKVDLVADGGQAVDLASRRQYDLILMDLFMPDVDGAEASRRIRQIPQCANTTILALTSEAFADTREKCLQAGINDQIAKPYDPEQLFSAIEHWLKLAQASKSGAGIEEPVA
jgi:signal transduction histidine kinase